ncbi:MAG: dTMP kinase [Candidatus Woesearchaeota archaeon]|nr:dTMP kinase [Candidatus Woesearchaeota archaeon]
MIKKGIFITIEGIHGSGKSTISQMLFERLKELKLDVIFVLDQAGTETGRKIRRINLEEGNDVDVLTEALLIASARRQNISEVIKPNLSQGKIVISERYVDAYFAFQGFARGLPLKFLECINDTISEGIMPDLTILLDLNPKIALSRLDLNLSHRIEREPLDFHKKVREGYLSQAKKYPDRIKIIDSDLSIDKVFEKVWKTVKDFLVLKGAIKC